MPMNPRRKRTDWFLVAMMIMAISASMQTAPQAKQEDVVPIVKKQSKSAGELALTAPAFHVDFYMNEEFLAALEKMGNKIRPELVSPELAKVLLMAMQGTNEELAFVQGPYADALKEAMERLAYDNYTDTEHWGPDIKDEKAVPNWVLAEISWLPVEKMEGTMRLLNDELDLGLFGPGQKADGSPCPVLPNIGGLAVINAAKTMQALRAEYPNLSADQSVIYARERAADHMAKEALGVASHFMPEYNGTSDVIKALIAEAKDARAEIQGFGQGAFNPKVEGATDFFKLTGNTKALTEMFEPKNLLQPTTPALEPQNEMEVSRPSPFKP